MLMRTAIDENDPTKRVPDIYQLLLQAMADSSIDTKAGAILFRALQLGYSPTISYLLSQGLKADIEDATGRTPLSHASQTHSTEMITLLLSYDASVNAQDKEGLAPLHWAFLVSPRPYYGNDYIEAVKLLLEHGADPMLKDNSGKTPLAWAKKAGKAGVVDLLKKAMEGKGVSQEDIEPSTSETQSA
jgi:ankyrin repeat protein